MLWQQGIVYLFISFVLGILGGFILNFLGSIFKHLPGKLVIRWIRDFCFCIISSTLLLFLMHQYDKGCFRLSPCIVYMVGMYQYFYWVAPSVENTINMFFTAVSKFAIIVKSRWRRRRTREDRYRHKT